MPSRPGPPCWHPSHEFARSLVIDDNGRDQDSFTSGDWVRIIRANVEAAFGQYQGSEGNILLYIGAPYTSIAGTTPSCATR